MMETLKAWQCIGCGKLEAPQTCIGVCQDRRVELVYASEYEAIAAALDRTRAERDALAALARRIAAFDPAQAGALDALRNEAREVLERPQAEVEPAQAPAVADGPLRDRRGAGAAVAALDVNAGGASQAAGITPADAGDKPRLRKPATLFVR